MRLISFHEVSGTAAPSEWVAIGAPNKVVAVNGSTNNGNCADAIDYIRSTGDGSQQWYTTGAGGGGSDANDPIHGVGVEIIGRRVAEAVKDGIIEPLLRSGSDSGTFGAYMSVICDWRVWYAWMPTNPWSTPTPGLPWKHADLPALEIGLRRLTRELKIEASEICLNKGINDARSFDEDAEVEVTRFRLVVNHGKDRGCPRCCCCCLCLEPVVKFAADFLTIDLTEVGGVGELEIGGFCLRFTYCGISFPFDNTCLHQWGVTEVGEDGQCVIPGTNEAIVATAGDYDFRLLAGSIVSAPISQAADACLFVVLQFGLYHLGGLLYLYEFSIHPILQQCEPYHLSIAGWDGPGSINVSTGGPYTPGEGDVTVTCNPGEGCTPIEPAP